MELLNTVVSEAMVERVGWVLVHFLWQGLAIGAVMWAAMKALGKASPNVRYLAACAGLLLIVAGPVVTFILLEPERAAPLPAAEIPTATMVREPVIVRETTIAPTAPAAPVEIPLWERAEAGLEAALPTCVAGWFAGVAGLSLWYLGGWCQTQRLRRIGTRAVSETVQATAAELAQRLGIRRAVGIAESALVQVPAVIGWLRPVVLLPVSALTGLDEAGLRAMIAHELSHVRRCDYLVNIAQTAVEILGFYHPAVWWMSRQVRIEREHCCDDMAVGLVEDRKGYARALFSMEAVRARQTELAMGASGGDLVQRIGRLAGTPMRQERSGWIPSLAAVLLAAALLLSTSAAMSSQEEKAESETAAANGETVVYPVNRRVSDFAAGEDFSTPESAYAAINRVMASGERDGWLRVSTRETATRIASMPAREPVNPEWAKAVLGARILEVWVADGHAAVIAEFPQEGIAVPIRLPIDSRHVELEDGRWLNAGEDRYDTVEQARAKFEAMAARQTELSDRQAVIDNALSSSEEILQAAQQLFADIQRADYEAFLNSEHPTWWNEFPTWNRYTAMKWHDELAKWICRTFAENPIVSVELGAVFISDLRYPEFENLPAVPYKLTLEDGGVLEGILPFLYYPADERTGQAAHWGGVHGIDWHLQAAPIGYDNAGDDLEQAPREAERVRQMLKLRDLGLQLFVWANRQDGVFPKTVAEAEFEDEALKAWAMENVEYLAEGKKWAAIEKPGETPIAYDLSLLEGGEGTNVLFADGHVEFVTPRGLETVLGDFIQEKTAALRAAETRQVLTRGYAVWVPGDMAELREIVPDSQGAKVITGEQLAAFLRAVRRHPTARVVTMPQALALNNEPVEIQISGGPGTESIQMEVTHRIAPDGETIRTEIQVVHIVPKGEGRSQHIVVTEARLLSGHGLVTGGQEVDGGKMLFLVQPQIVEEEDAPADAPLPPPAGGGGFGGLRGATGAAPGAGGIQFPVNWDAIAGPGEKAEELADQSNDPNAYRNVVYDVSELTFPAGSMQAWEPDKGLEELRQDIMERIEPASWFEAGGEGRIQSFGPDKLIVWQRPEVHAKVEAYLAERREALPDQVAVEARLIWVKTLAEDLLPETAAPPRGQVVEGLADSEAIRAALERTPLAETDLPLDRFEALDDLQRQLIIRQAQSLSAPKAIVLEGEEAVMEVGEEKYYVDTSGEKKKVPDSVRVSVLPTITEEGQVRLKARAVISKVLEWRSVEREGKTYQIPCVQVVTVPVHAVTEDQKTLLAVGLEVKDAEGEAKRLLVLIKPTVLKRQTEEEAIGNISREPHPLLSF